jgi:hypothetical protein
MPTITLTIDAETLDAMQRGEAVQLTATLRRKREKKQASLTPEQEAMHKGISDLLASRGQESHIPKVWKDVKAALSDEHPEDVLVALDVCLDWCEGATLAPKVAWFARDYGEWRARSQGDLMGQEVERTNWRKARGAA